VEHGRKPTWYYVGNGQLRFMDADGWTDQYRNIDDPAPAALAEDPVHRFSPAPQEGLSSQVRTWLIAVTTAGVTAVVLGAGWSTGAFFDAGPPQQSTVASLQGVAPKATTRPAAAKPKPTPAPSADKAAATTPQAAAVPSPRTLRIASTSKQVAVSTTESPTEFRQARALSKAADVIADLAVVDKCLGEGTDVDSALILLGRSYGRLADVGVPPALQRTDYLVQVRSLETLTIEAAEGYAADPTKATAAYLEVRSRTGALVKQINKATGSRLSLR
jgi:hypothetical protein